MKKKNVLGRLLKDIFKQYKVHLIIVFLCIIGNAIATVQGTLFMQVLIDDYIIPLMGTASPDFTGLFHALLRVAGFFLLGIICAYSYNRIMVSVTQGYLRNMRIHLFEHMESLPIRYFDRTPHGDIMSVYTNDTDTLRQLISQSIPQLVSSAITIITVFISMLTLSLPLTGVSMIMLCIMIFTSQKLGGLSGRYFVQ